MKTLRRPNKVDMGSPLPKEKEFGFDETIEKEQAKSRKILHPKQNT